MSVMSITSAMLYDDDEYYRHHHEACHGGKSVGFDSHGIVMIDGRF